MGALSYGVNLWAYYFLTIIDDCNHVVWVYLLKAKNEASRYIINFGKIIKAQFGKKVKFIRSDNRLEFDLGPIR